MSAALRNAQVSATVAQRRDDFLSPHVRWLVATLSQIVRPLDRRNIVVLIESFNRIADIAVAPDQVLADAETTGRSYISTWIDAVRQLNPAAPHMRLVELIAPVTGDPAAARTTMQET